MTDENNSTGKVNFNEVSIRRSLHLLPSFPLELFLPTKILETILFWGVRKISIHSRTLFLFLLLLY